MPHLAYIAAVTAAGLVGGLVSAFWSPNRWLTSYIQHFDAPAGPGRLRVRRAPHDRGQVGDPVDRRAAAAPAAKTLGAHHCRGGRYRHRRGTVLAVVLSFGAAALLYLVTEELLVETRLPEETLMSTAMFFLGFLVIFAFVLAG